MHVLYVAMTRIEDQELRKETVKNNFPKGTANKQTN